MARGRKPQLGAIKILKGTRAETLPASAGAPPSTRRPSPPESLDAPALEAWIRLADLLAERGILDLSHGPALDLYASAFSRFLEAKAFLREHGLLIRSGGSTRTSAAGAVIETEGALKKNPAAEVAAQAESLMLRILQDFGLTAASSLKVPAKAAEEDKLAAFLHSRQA